MTKRMVADPEWVSKQMTNWLIDPNNAALFHNASRLVTKGTKGQIVLFVDTSLQKLALCYDDPNEFRKFMTREFPKHGDAAETAIDWATMIKSDPDVYPCLLYKEWSPGITTCTAFRMPYIVLPTAAECAAVDLTAEFLVFQRLIAAMVARRKLDPS